MPKSKPSTVELQVFKGREAKLNKAIFSILAHRGPRAVNALLERSESKEAYRIQGTVSCVEG